MRICPACGEGCLERREVSSPPNVSKLFLEEPLFSDCLLILRASRPDGLDFRDLGDGYIPPGFVSRDVLIVRGLNDDNGCLLETYWRREAPV